LRKERHTSGRWNGHLRDQVAALVMVVMVIRAHSTSPAAKGMAAREAKGRGLTNGMAAV